MPRKCSRPLHGREVEVSAKGRHDPCVGIRAVPVNEAMVACVVADHCSPPRTGWGNRATVAVCHRDSFPAVILDLAGTAESRLPFHG